jgi:hypothetical protein
MRVVEARGEGVYACSMFVCACCSIRAKLAYASNDFA